MPLSSVAAPAHSITMPSTKPVWNVKYTQNCGLDHASYVPTKQKPAIAKRHNATMNLMHRVYRFASGLYGFARTTLRCNFTTYVGKALQWSIIRRL